jgi:hypothetical protein
MDVSATTALVVALVGLAVGAVSLGLAWWGYVKVRRVRDAQRLMLGGGRRDLVEFAVTLQGRVDDLHRAVDEVRKARSSATTRTRTPAVTSRPRLRCSTPPEPGSSSRRSRAATTRAST